MKKTHKAVLHYLESADASIASIRSYLLINFPDMEMGLTKWNVGLMMKNLYKMGYVETGFPKMGFYYGISEKGKRYLKRMKESDMLYDKPSGS